MLDHQPQYVKKSQPDPRSRYESFHQATLEVLKRMAGG